MCDMTHCTNDNRARKTNGAPKGAVCSCGTYSAEACVDSA